MKKFFPSISVTLLLSILTLKVNSQVWREVKNLYNADYRVYVTKKKEEATLIGFRVDHEWDIRKPGHIYVLPSYFTRGKKIFYTENIRSADIIVYWTKSKSEACWKR